MDKADLKARLREERILLAAGTYDAMSALLAEQAGAEACYLSGASIAYTRIGVPDIGLVAMTEVVDTLRLVRERIAAPLFVDADDGYGNALNVQRTVRLFEQSGADVVQIEDQAAPKRCGQLSGKRLVSTADMVGKIKAALDARHDEKTLVMARTDAIAVEGLGSAMERAGRYADAGADLLFVEAPQNTEQMRAICQGLGQRTPLLANMVEGGKSPVLPARELREIGFKGVIFPGGAVRALAHALRAYYAGLVGDGTTERFWSRMLSFDELNAVIKTPRFVELGKQYDPEAR